MSVVHRAHDEVLERDVAVKVLVGSDAVARRRIRAEAKAAARMSHPNVTNVYDYGESSLAGEQVPFVVMELLTGRTLEQRLADGPLPPGPPYGSAPRWRPPSRPRTPSAWCTGTSSRAT